MRFIDYAYPNADLDTMRIPALEPTPDEVESYLLLQLEALLSVSCPRGHMPGTLKTYAEQKAELVAELLNDLRAYRQTKRDSANKIYPEKRRRKWGKP